MKLHTVSYFILFYTLHVLAVIAIFISLLYSNEVIFYATLLLLVPLEKKIVAQQSKMFPTPCGTQMFITIFTKCYQ
jgi:hypothetical protein